MVPSTSLQYMYDAHNYSKFSTTTKRNYNDEVQCNLDPLHPFFSHNNAYYFRSEAS